jgi:hypothetical protein
MNILKILCFTCIAVNLFLSGCSDKKDPGTASGVGILKGNYHKIISNGYGESEEKAVEDAKNDALRQFGFNIATNGGKPELVYAGKIVGYRVVSNFTEELKNGMWWEIKIEAEIEKL